VLRERRAALTFPRLMAKSLLVLIEGTDELLPVAQGIGAKRIDGSIYHWRADASGAMPETYISCTGVGTKRSYECTKKRIAETNPGLIVSAGTFGAIVEGISLQHWMCNARTRMLGDVSEQRAQRDDIDGDATHAAYIKRLREGCEAVGVKWLEGRLICVGDVPLFKEEEKAALAAKHDAVGVDMETFGIAQAAREAGIPWLTARVCVDTPSIPLPDFGALNHTTGRPYYGRLFKWIFLHPIKCVPTLYGLWKLVNVYGKQLARIIREGYLKP
jgi:nucleoside phosphorylase